MQNYYKQVSDERYEILLNRYDKFSQGLDDINQEPVKVFDPLPKNLIDELQLIREASKYLQKKKEEDLSKDAKAAQQAEEDAKKKAEEVAKEVEKEDA